MRPGRVMPGRLACHARTLRVSCPDISPKWANGTGAVSVPPECTQTPPEGGFGYGAGSGAATAVPTAPATVRGRHADV